MANHTSKGLTAPDQADRPKIHTPTTYLEAIQLINQGEEIVIPLGYVRDLIIAGATLQEAKWCIKYSGGLVQIKRVSTTASPAVNPSARTHATEQDPYWYHHAKGEPLCACEYPRIWMSWPHECRNCCRILRPPAKPSA